MRRALVSLIATLSLAAAAMPALAHGGHLHFDDADCNFGSDYDVTVDTSGIRFQRDDGTPHEVFMHDGAVRMDGRALALSDADADRVREYERGVRELVPRLTEVVREGIDIGYSALTTVAATFAEDGSDRRHMLDKLERSHADALRRIDETMGRGIWRHRDMEDGIENAVESAVPALVGSITSRAVSAALSGDESRVKALEARADSLDQSIEREVDARADRLEAKARLLCPGIHRLQALQDAWKLRAPDGSTLRLIDRHDHDGDAPAHDDKGQVAAR